MTKPPQTAKSDLESLWSSDDLRAAAAWFAAKKAWILEQQLAICRIPAPTFLEQRRAEAIQQMMAALGYSAELDAVGNMVALRDRGSEKPIVAISAHMDTVLAPRRPDDVLVDADGVVRGPGVADNGAGLSAILALASAFTSVGKHHEWPYSLALVANVGEEGEGNLTGMRYLCQDSPLAHRLAGVLVLDGPGHEHITSQALASRRFEVVMQGKGGHSWSDFGTVNPIHALSRAVSLFSDSNPPTRSTSDDRFSVNVGVIQGGSTINSIPQSASAKVDIRSEHNSMIDDLAASLGRCIEQSVALEHQYAKRGRLTARLREIGARPGGGLAVNSPLMTTVLAIDRAMSIRSQLDTSSTDANIPLSMGIPAVALGAGGTGGGAHTSEEWYRPDGRDLGLRRAFLVACAMLSALAIPESSG